MFFISKSKKGSEFMYMKEFTIACNSKKQAEKLADYLNENDNTTIGIWKLEDDQTWYVHEDGYIIPLWKLKRRNGKIVVTPNTNKY